MGIVYDDMLEHVKFLARQFGRDNSRYVIVILLLELDVPTNFDGFDYLVDAIEIYFEEPSQVIVKGLYPAVAKVSRKRVVGAMVESAIRSAIKAAWKKNNNEAWQMYFPTDAVRPSNTAFISKIARIMELWEGCCREYERKKCEGEVLV